MLEKNSPDFLIHQIQLLFQIQMDPGINKCYNVIAYIHT